MTTLTLPPPHELSIAASAEQLKALQDQIRAVIEAGEAPLSAIREMCGPDALGIAGELLKRFNFGLAQFRECDATLSSLWRAKNTAEMRLERTGAETAQTEPFSAKIQRETDGAEMRRNPYGHTMQEQSRTAGDTPGDGEAQPGEAERGAAQEGAADVSPCASGLPGEDAAAVAAPLCQVGGRIEMRHTLGLDGRCSVCSWEYPKLNL